MTRKPSLDLSEQRLDLTEIAEGLVGELATALEATAIREPGARAFAAKLVGELRAAGPRRNPSCPEGVAPTEAVRRIVEGFGRGTGNPIAEAICRLMPTFAWLQSVEFYPEPEHRHFAERLWGAIIVGQEDALFIAEERYIALLMVMEPNTTYPLHAHRIEELYYVLSGAADWSHDGETWTTLPPGSVFHNHSYQAHSMRMRSEPLIAMGFYLPPFGWEGGLLPLQP